MSPHDPIQTDGPRYDPGKIPARFIVMLSDGKATLNGPYQFPTQPLADRFLAANPQYTHYLIIPSPTDEYELPEIPGIKN